MNGYELSRQWFDFLFENPDITNTSQSVLYMWLIESNNRKGFVEKFVFNSEEACAYTRIKDRKTVWSALNKLVEHGFVTIVKKATNQNQVTTISIINNKVKSKGCLDRALCLSNKTTSDGPAMDQQVNGTPTSDGLAIGLSLKPINKETKKQRNIPQQVAFSEFWDLYEKKVDKKACQKIWLKLGYEDQCKILAHVPKYIKSTPDKQFRKNPESYLNANAWENEILSKSGQPEKKELEIKPNGYPNPQVYYMTCWEKKIKPVRWENGDVLSESEIEQQHKLHKVGDYQYA